MWPRKKQQEQESFRALHESRLKLQETELRSPAITEVATALRSLRERNHFAEQLQSIMGGPRT